MGLRALLALALVLAPTPRLSAQDGPVVIYLVRHAERADDDAPTAAMLAEDPPLSEAGLVRAAQLADLLRPVGITDVHSTDYERARATALPTSRAAGVALELYDPEELDGLARALRQAPGTHLVVGHSNTTTELVEALGGEPGGPIAPLEYDRIYVVYILPAGATGSSVFRYGSPYAGGS